MAIPSTQGGLPIAREQYFDQGENVDVSQVLGRGGVVNAGQTSNNQLYGQAMATDGITATPAATQANAVLITTPLFRVTTSAAGSGVLLPPAVRGMEVTLANDGVNTIQVFASGTDTINAVAGSTGVTQIATNVTIYIAFSNGLWRTK